MSQHYTDPKRESDPYTLPDLETFYIGPNEPEETCPQCNDPESDTPDAEYADHADHVGWYYWFCLPGCMPDSDPYGPFASEDEAIEDARENAGIFDEDE